MNRALIIIAAILVISGLKAAMILTMPLTFGVLVTALVYPLFDRMHRILPYGAKWLAYVGAMAVVVGTLGLLVTGIWFSLSLVQTKGPGYVTQLQSMWADLHMWAEARNLTLPSVADEADQILREIAGLLPSFVRTIWSVSAYLVLIFFFTLLTLIEAKHWDRKIFAALPAEQARAAHRAAITIAGKIQQYLLVRTIVSAISGLAAGLWLWLLGVDFALVWGLLTFILNYIPNIGSVISAVLPTFVALLQFGPGQAAIAIFGLTAIEQVIGNFIDPRLQGRQLDMSPLVVLASVLFWGWVWGVAGALLAVPITISIIIVCSQIDGMEPVSRLLSGSGGVIGARRRQAPETPDPRA